MQIKKPTTPPPAGRYSGDAIIGQTKNKDARPDLVAGGAEDEEEQQRGYISEQRSEAWPWHLALAGGEKESEVESEIEN